MQPCNRNLLETIELARKLLALSDQGEMDAEDDSCSVLYGIMRDCAYRIQRRAEREIAAHDSKGMWDGQEQKFFFL
jgi:hypothetical protein